MATVTGYTAARMQAIEDTAIVDARVDVDHLILIQHDLTEIDVGDIRGPQGIPGVPGSSGQATLVDTSANLAANNPVIEVGRLVLASDTGVIKMGDGVTAYNTLPSIRNLTVPQRATSILAQTGITGTVDVTGLSVTFTVGTVPWKVEVYLPYITAVTSGAIGNIYIADALNTTAQVPFTLVGAGSMDKGYACEYISTPGTYTRRARVGRSSGTGTITILANLAVLTAFINAAPDR